jgi:thymidine kinase
MPGTLTVICGPMFAGKSTALIARAHAARAAGRRVAIIKPAWDDRYDAARIVTHHGLVEDATPVRTAADILEVVARGGVMPELVLIDEAHFFGDALVAPVLALVRDGAAVVVAGVERDHRGGAFAPFPALLVEADEVVKVSAVCARCGGSAVHSQRMTSDDAHIVVGGAEMYEARCRACFEGGNAQKRG